jgi:hypothetical protein
MMNRQRQGRSPIYSQRRPVAGALSAGVLCVLASVASTVASGDDSISGFDQITLAPGDTGNCNSSPCTIYLKMPEGTGTYVVMSSGNGRVGEYPAGETVNLGSFWNSQAFTIEGMDVPKAYAYIAEEP